MDWICNYCGSNNDGGDRKCVVCGEAHPREIQCICPVCGNAQRAFPGMRCGHCGHVFAQEDLFTLPRDPDPVPARGAEEIKRKSPSSAVIIAVTAIVVAGALAALFIVKYFDRDKRVRNGNDEPAAATVVTADQAAAPTTAPPADPPTTAPATVPATVPQTAPPTAPPATVPPTAPPQTQPPAQYVPSAAPYIVRTRTGDGLYLRTGPGVNYPYILEMPNLSTVYYTGSASNGFMSVDYTVNGKTYSGWASAGYLEAQSGSYPVSYVSYNTDGHAGINLRSQPTPQSQKLRILSEGTAVYRLGSTTGDYTLVRTTDGVQGWVMWKYLN